MRTIEVHRRYYLRTFRVLKKGYSWPLHMVYDKEDFIDGRAPSFAWDEIDDYGCVIYSLNQTPVVRP